MLVELSEQAAQELAEGSTAIGRVAELEACAAIGRVAELEARVAELEGQGRRLEAEKVEIEKALRKEKRGKEPDRRLLCSFRAVLSLTCFCLELEACTMANEEMQKLWDVAEAREAATEEKLHLEQQARRGMILKSYNRWVCVILTAWTDPAECFFCRSG